jgi:hypothetical protein
MIHDRKEDVYWESSRSDRGTRNKMKKLIHVIILASLVLALWPAAVSAQDEVPDNSWTFELYAGQDILVGYLYIWNTSDTLYIRYETFPEWAMTETHLQVEVSTGDYQSTLDLFPTTKKSDAPKIGQFDYKMSSDAGTTWFNYEIPLWAVFGCNEGEVCWEWGDTVAVAAHASMDRAQVETLVSEAGVEGYKWEALVDEFGNPVVDELGNAVWGWVGPEPATAIPPEASPIPNMNVFGHDTWITLEGAGSTDLRFVDQTTESFPLDVQYIPGWIGVASTGVEQVLFNGQAPVAEPVVEDSITYYEVTPVAGINTVEFVISDSTEAPTSILYKAMLAYIAQQETAWAFYAGGESYADFGGGWGGIIEYTLEEPPPPLLAWPSGDGMMSLAFEDAVGVDYDYNDWVVDLHTVVTQDELGRVTGIDFDILPEARGAAYKHVFHMRFPAGIFEGPVNATLTLYDAVGNPAYVDADGVPIPVEELVFDDLGNLIPPILFDGAVGIDFTVIPDTMVALPNYDPPFQERYTNTCEPWVDDGTGAPILPSHFLGKYADYVPPQMTAKLSLVLEPQTTFVLPDYDTLLTDWFGVQLAATFFDPYIHVIEMDWGDPPAPVGGEWDIPDPYSPSVDERRLVVPADWLWPEAGVHIAQPYTLVTDGPGVPPTFPGGTEWWRTTLHDAYTEGDSTLYQGKLLYGNGGTFPITQ